VANKTPPAVPVTPPKLYVPVFGIPNFVSSSYYPKGICQILLPVFKFIAVSLPKGGLDPG